MGIISLIIYTTMSKPILRNSTLSMLFVYVYIVTAVEVSSTEWDGG